MRWDNILGLYVLEPTATFKIEYSSNYNECLSPFRKRGDHFIQSVYVALLLLLVVKRDTTEYFYMSQYNTIIVTYVF